MSRFFDGSGDYLSQSSTGVTNVPMTLACWYQAWDYSAARFLLASKANTAGANHHHALYLWTDGNVWAEARTTAGSQATSSGGNKEPGWKHAAGVFASATSRVAYYNGRPGSANTTERIVDNAVGSVLGINNSVSLASPHLGLIAHPAIWNVALTPAEVAALAAGASPLSIRRENLVRYWPRLGKRERELCVVSGTELVATNATPHADEPRLWTPKRRIWVPVDAGGGQTVEAGISAETDSAFAVTIAKRLAIGLNTETDSGFAVTRAKRKAIGLNTETDSAFSLARFKVKIAGLNTETDSAFATAKAKRYAAGLNTETDTALPVSGSQAILAGIAEAIDTALAVTKRIAKAVGLTTETDSALPVVNATIVAVGQAQETDSAFSVAKLKRKLVGLAREFDSAKKITSTVTVAWGLKFPLIRPMVRNLIQSWRSRRFPWKEPF